MTVSRDSESRSPLVECVCLCSCLAHISPIQCCWFWWCLEGSGFMTEWRPPWLQQVPHKRKYTAFPSSSLPLSLSLFFSFMSSALGWYNRKVLTRCGPQSWICQRYLLQVFQHQVFDYKSIKWTKSLLPILTIVLCNDTDLVVTLKGYFSCSQFIIIRMSVFLFLCSYLCG